MNKKQENVVIIYTTFPSKRDASRIGKMLVSEKLAGCINIFDKVHAIYDWQGDIQEETEFGAYIKTTGALSPELIKKLKELHPYEVPAIFMIDPLSTDPDYAKWIEKQVL